MNTSNAPVATVRQDVELGRYRIRFYPHTDTHPLLIDLGGSSTLWWYVPFDGSLEPSRQGVSPFQPRWSESYFADRPKLGTVVGVFHVGTARAFDRALRQHAPQLRVTGLTQFL